MAVASSTNTLAGLTSRCTSPLGGRRRAPRRPARRCGGPLRLDRALPRRSFSRSLTLHERIARNRCPSSSPVSWTGTMLGWSQPCRAPRLRGGSARRSRSSRASSGRDQLQRDGPVQRELAWPGRPRPCRRGRRAGRPDSRRRSCRRPTHLRGPFRGGASPRRPYHGSPRLSKRSEAGSDPSPGLRARSAGTFTTRSTGGLRGAPRVGWRTKRHGYRSG